MSCQSVWVVVWILPQSRKKKLAPLRHRVEKKATREESAKRARSKGCSQSPSLTSILRRVSSLVCLVVPSSLPHFFVVAFWEAEGQGSIEEERAKWQ